MEPKDKLLYELNEAIAKSPKTAKEFAQRGEIYRQTKCYEKAITDFNQAIELQPDYAWAIAHRAIAYRRLMRYEEALADLNRAIDLKPNYAWAHAYRGVIYSILTCYEEAIAQFDRAIALDETFKSHWGNERGFPLTCIGRYSEAIESYQQTLKVRQDDPFALYCIAVTQAHWQGLALAQIQIDKARSVFLSMADATIPSVALYGSDAALYGLGGLASLEGHFEQGLNYLQEAISLEADLNIEMARRDPAWSQLQGDPRFQSLISRNID